MLQLVYLGSGELIRYVPDEQDLRATERKVEAIWRAIAKATESGDWRPNRSKLCEWCSFQSLCPEFGGTPPPLPVREPADPGELTAEDVDFFLFHQANQRILDAIAEYAKIPEHKMFNNVHKYGNTSAASVPICIHEAYTSGRIREGDLVLTAAFGAGFAWGASLFRW